MPVANLDPIFVVQALDRPARLPRLERTSRELILIPGRGVMVDTPDCAIRTALENGDPDERRISAYRKTEREIAHQEKQLIVRKRRADQRAAGRRHRRARNKVVEW